jgi:hypothetical protein
MPLPKPAYVVPCLLWSGASLRSPAERRPMLHRNASCGLREAFEFFCSCFSAPQYAFSLDLKRRSKFLDTKLCLQCVREISSLVLWLCSWFELPIFAANHVGFFSQRRLQGCKMVSNDTWKLDLDVFSRNLWCRSLSDRVSLRMNQRWNSRAASWRRGDWEDLCVVN